MKRYLLLFTFLTFLIFWPVFFGKVNLNGNLLVSFYPPWGENLPFKNTGWDQLRIYFPFWKVTLDSIKNLEIPLWNPYAFSGHPHAADFQSAVFYPLNIFGLVMSQIVFWHFLRITPTVLAAFFTFIYLRNLKLSKAASIFGAMTFGFSPFILTWGEEVIMSPHSIAWLPLILLSIDRFRESGKRKFLMLISLGLAASFLGGYMQTTIYLGVFAVLYFLLRFGRSLFSQKGRLTIVAFIFGVLIAAVGLLPSGELYFRSARHSVALTDQLYAFLLPVESLVTYLAPDFFGHPARGNFFRSGSAQYYEGIMFVGVAAVIFAAYAAVKTRRAPLTLFLVILAFGALLLTIDWPISRLFLRLPIPFLSTSIANRILFIPAFSLSILAAVGFNVWQKSPDRKIIRVVIITGVLYLALAVGLLVFGALGFAQWRVSFRNLALPLFIFILTGMAVYFAQKQKIAKGLAAFLIIAISFLHIFYFAYKYFSFSDRQYVFPKEGVLNFILKNQGNFRTWGAGEAFLENNFASQYGIYFAEGYDSLNNRRYAEFTYAMQGNRLSDFVFRADAGVGRGGTSEALLANAQRRRLIDLLGTRYVIAPERDGVSLSASNFKKVFPPAPAAPDSEGQVGKIAVFENLKVVPRAFLASSYEKIEKDEEIIKRLLSDDFEVAKSLVLEKDAAISPQAGDGSVEILSYKPQEVVIKTRADQPKLLFLSDNFYPGWKAEVDGDETEILRADYTFRAVPLIAGEHTVRFYFDPISFKLGAIISLVSLFGLGFLVKPKYKF
ncbi:YfhO family protein [Candidatus Curtissbacteria bacterium]|nr:YfhO family protein [Candidatus Curtissbacteria bacterium]